jgi:hypothetical protein
MSCCLQLVCSGTVPGGRPLASEMLGDGAERAVCTYVLT